MTKRHFSTIVCCLFFLLATTAQTLYVGSYNIRNQNKRDSLNGNGWERRCPVICTQLNFEHPDIFGAQEVLEPQLRNMLSMLDGYDYIGVGRDDGKKAGEYEPIFYDRKKLQLKEHGNFWLSETPEKPGLGWDAVCIRICTWGRFVNIKDGTAFYFYNLHMDHVGTVARREAAKLVVQRIRERAHQECPVILTGDFNVDQENEIYQIFVTSGVLTDSYERARMRFAENGTFNSFDPELKTTSRIDHVFVSPSFEVDRYAVLTNGYWTAEDTAAQDVKGHDAPQEISFRHHVKRLPSDHYPVMVRLER